VSEKIDVRRGYIEPETNLTELREFLCGFKYELEYGKNLVEHNKCYYDDDRNKQLKKIYEDKAKVRAFLESSNIANSIKESINYYVKDETNWEKSGKY